MSTLTKHPRTIRQVPDAAKGQYDRPLAFTIAVSGYKTKFRSCIQSQRRYFKKCNYEFRVIDRLPWSLSASDSAWLKIRLLREFCLAGYQRVLFVDADCEIRPHAPPIFETVVKPGKVLYAAPGKSGRLNSGLILVESNCQVLELLQQMLDSADEDVPLEDQAPYENGHFIHYAKDVAWMLELDHNQWNNNSTYDETSFIQHYSGGPLRRSFDTRFWVRVTDGWIRWQRRWLRLKGTPRGFADETVTNRRLTKVLAAWNGYRGELA